MLYIEIQSQYSLNGSADIISLSDSLRGKGIELHDIAYLANNVSTTKTFKAHENNVFNDGINRLLLAEVKTLTEIDTKTSSETKNAVSEFYERINNIYENIKSPVKNLGEIVKGEIVPEIKKILEGDYVPEKLMTGINAIDYFYNGFVKGSMYILAARPGCGKTAVALQCCLNIAETEPVLFMSLEMNRASLAKRALSNMSEMNISPFIESNYTNEHGEYIPMYEALAESKKLDIVDTVYRYVEDLILTMDYLVQSKKHKFIVVDYFQLIDTNERTFSQVNSLEIVANKLTKFAKENDVVLLVLSQSNRSSEATQYSEPSMSDLKGSSQLEQNAAGISFLSYSCVVDKDTNRLTVTTLKNRFGNTGNKQVSFDGSKMTVTDTCTSVKWE